MCLQKWPQDTEEDLICSNQGHYLLFVFLMISSYMINGSFIITGL